MLQTAQTFTLTGRNNQFDPQLSIYQTVFFSDTTVTATVALSAFTQGIDLDNRRAGFAAAFITKAGVVTAPGRTDNLPLDPRDVTRNQIHIPHCSYITFRLVLTLAEASAVASVFVEGGLLPAGWVHRSARIVERATGRLAGVHHVAVPSDRRGPSDALVLRRVRTCAAEAWDVSPRALLVTLGDAPAPKRRAAAGSGRGRATGTTAAGEGLLARTQAR